jgi:hypothetical protein
MTTNDDMTDDQILADAMEISSRRISSMADQARDLVAQIEKAREAQPERLAKARSDAEEARGWALIEEPLGGQIRSLGSTDGDATLTLPNMLAKELWGARLAFDLLDCDDDYDEIDAVTSRLFTAAGGDPGVMMVIQAAALSTIASLIVPELLRVIETQGSDYNERVRLCEARAKAWHGRVHEMRQADDEAKETGVEGIDGYDIGSDALDDDGSESW